MRTRSWFSVGGAVALCLIAVPASAQQPGGGGFGGFGGGGGALALLANEKVIAELELVDDQVAELKAIRDKSAEEMRGLFGGGGGERPSREEIQEKIKTFTEGTQKKVDKILLPNQAKRLKQLEFQQRTARGGVTSTAAIEALKIDDEQKETLTAKAKEVNDALAKKIAKLRAEAQEELLKSCTAEQRATYKELSGEAFDFGPQGGFGGFGGGGAGGFGGAGGRGGQPGAPGGAGGRGGRGGAGGGGGRPARPE